MVTGNSVITMPKVSVIIPAYNSDTYLNDAMTSVLKQTYCDFELIVVDDGSQDSTADVVKKCKDKRVKYFYKTNGGASSARNTGIAKAQGDYIAFLDADDLWPENYLDVMYSAMKKNSEFGVAYCALCQEYPNGRCTNNFKIKHCRSGWITEALFKKFFVLAQACLARREIIRNFRFDESLQTADDYDGFLRLSTKTRFLFVPDVNTIRRVHDESLTATSGSMKVQLNKIRVLERFYFELGGKNYIDKRKALRRIGLCYVKSGKMHYERKLYKAANKLFWKAVRVNPLSLRGYRGLLKVMIAGKSEDPMPDWEMPTPLGPITSTI